MAWYIKGNQDYSSNMMGIWRQEWMQRPWKSAAYWLVPHTLLSLLSYGIKDHHQSTVGWALPPKLYRFYCSPVFSIEKGSLLSEDSSQQQVDIN